METNNTYLTLTAISIFAIILGPVLAVLVGQYLQNRKKKYDAKMELFLTLLSYRGNQVHPEFVGALNLIDVVFYDDPNALADWHKYYDLLGRPAGTVLPVVYQRSFLELVDVLSISLGYKHLRQTDVDKVYHPRAHDTLEALEEVFRKDLGDFLKNGSLCFAKLLSNVEKVNQPNQEG